jgi:nucleotide-binding universal stress UspA family protein
MSTHIKRILVPLDGSRLAESILPVVTTLARCLHAKVSLLHIIEENAPQSVHGFPHLTSTQEAEAYIANIAAGLASDLEVEQHVHGTEEHNVALSVALHSDELDADMVALCTHGRSGLRRAVSGSIAQQVLRRVKIPVILARPDMRAPASLGLVMLPLDSQGEGEVALPIAAEIAKECGATLRLVSIVPTVGTLTGDKSAAARLLPNATAASLDTQVDEEVRPYLERILAQLASDGVKTEAEIRRGNIGHVLVKDAAANKADLIVIATHARAGLGALFIGSIAAGLVTKVSQPLLLVRIAE